MPRFAKKGSTKTDILEQMFKEIHNHEDAEYHEVKDITTGQDTTLDKIKQFSDIDPNDYKELIDAYIELRVAYDDTAPANKDVQKINFDFENNGATDEFYDKDIDKHSQLTDGTAIIWAFAGGDWEMPVQFVLYLDPKNKIRAYIPSDGNVYCHKCKCAYGSCECDDQQEEFDDDYYTDHLDFNAMFEDVNNRIETK